MDSGKAQKIVTGSILITLIIGIMNSIYKKDSLPNFRFFFGTGILWLILSTMAEWEADIAQSFSIAIATFTVLGEGGGVLDHFLGSGASESTLETTPKHSSGSASGGAPQTAVVLRHPTGVNAVGVGYPVPPHVQAPSRAGLA